MDVGSGLVPVLVRAHYAVFDKELDLGYNLVWVEAVQMKPLPQMVEFLVQEGQGSGMPPSLPEDRRSLDVPQMEKHLELLDILVEDSGTHTGNPSNTILVSMGMMKADGKSAVWLVEQAEER